MYYIQINKKTLATPEDTSSGESASGESATKSPDDLIYYCRNCGFEDKELTVDNICVLNTQLKASKAKYMHMVNEYTKYDPTLPRTSTMQCPNDECLSRTKKDVKAEVMYLRYDDTNLKYVYLCVHCNQTWLS